MKRFTETAKWADPWFRGLSLKHKALWLWLLDNCDCAGVLPEIDWALVSFQVGAPVDGSDMDALSGRMARVGKSWWIVKFVLFQYGKIEPDREAGPVKGVRRALDRIGIAIEDANDGVAPRSQNPLVTLSEGLGNPSETLTEPFGKGYQTLQDKDKDKDSSSEDRGVQRRKEADPELPFDSPDFSSAWSLWVQHRREIRRPLKPAMTAQMLQTLEQMGEARAIAAIRHTVAMGWQGLREPERPAGANDFSPEENGRLYAGMNLAQMRAAGVA